MGQLAIRLPIGVTAAEEKDSLLKILCRRQMGAEITESYLSSLSCSTPKPGLQLDRDQVARPPTSRTFRTDKVQHSFYKSVWNIIQLPWNNLHYKNLRSLPSCISEVFHWGQHTQSTNLCHVIWWLPCPHTRYTCSIEVLSGQHTWPTLSGPRGLARVLVTATGSSAMIPSCNVSL